MDRIPKNTSDIDMSDESEQYYWKLFDDEELQYDFNPEIGRAHV